MCMMSEGFLGPTNVEPNEDANKKLGATAKDTTEGINVSYFIKNCSFLAGTLPHISKRLLAAIGMDVQNANAKIDWNTYLELYCIFESGNIEKDALIRFWIKFFDPKLIGTVPEDEYMQLLEELIRGNSLSEPNDTTRMFARMFQKMMNNANVLGENNEIINEKLFNAFLTDTIDIKALGCSLGR